jgi:hypothetical protein
MKRPQNEEIMVEVEVWRVEEGRKRLVKRCVGDICIEYE